ncbi:hypothetical protein JRQ81_001819 [Phrynocephalus forsythii]|uniref:Uncharacterized protein n=1 Tax=Phrynocephalus forsythii TaxID=171643 RepID=A0A9Q1BA23_9SAUR|nr:hypothetical protein JRQ81_001819 [Phrynocephalus forsythii]
MTNSQKGVEGPNAEKTFSHPAHSTDAVSSPGRGEGRTLQTIVNSVPASAAVTGSSTSHTSRHTRSSHLTHISSPGTRTRKMDMASANTVDTATLETMTLSTSYPKTSVVSEINHFATENSYPLDSSWNADSTTSNLPSGNMVHSAKTNRGGERTSLFLTESVTLTDSARRNTISAKQMITSFDQSRSLSPATRSRGISSTAEVTSHPDSSVGTILTHSYFSVETTAEDRHLLGKGSNTERTVSASPVESTSLVGISDRSRERTLQTRRDLRSSYNATQISTTPNNNISGSDYPYTVQTRQMDLSTEATELSVTMISQSPAPSEIIGAEDNTQPRSSLHRERSVLTSHTDSGSVSGLSDRGEERTLQTLGENATELSTTMNTKSSKTVRLAHFSSLSTAVEATQTDFSARDNVITEAAVSHSLAPSKTAAGEDRGLSRSRSHTKTSVSSSHRKNVSPVGLSNKREEMILQTLKDTSSSYNATQIPTISSNELSSILGLTDSPVQTRQMDMSPGNTDVRNITSSETTASEDGGPLKWSSHTKDTVSSSEAESISVPGVSDRVRERTLRTLRDVSSSLNAAQRVTTSSNDVFSSLGLTDSSSVLTPVEVGQMDLSPGNTDITPLETTAVEDRPERRSSSDTQRETSPYPLGSHSAPDLSDGGGERTLQTLRGISTSHNATQVSIVSGKEISSSSDLTDFSSVLTSVPTGQTDMSWHTVYTEGTVTESQPTSEATAVEDRGLLSWSSNTEKGVSSPESESVSVSDLFDKGEDGTLQTLRDATSYFNGAQRTTVFSYETLHSLALTDSSSLSTPVKAEQVDLTAGNVDFTEATLMHSQAPSEITSVKDNEHTFSHFSTERSDAQTESMFSVVTLVRSGNGTLRSLTDGMKSTDLKELSTFEFGRC